MRLVKSVVTVLFLATSVSAATTVVTPSNPGNWVSTEEALCRGSDPYQGSATYVTGPGSPPAGIGSLQMSVGALGDSSPRMFLKQFTGTRLDALTTLQYSTYVQAYQGSQDIYLRLYLDTDGNTTVDDSILFEPAYQTAASGNPALPDQGAIATGTWQTWNALTGGWWSNNGFCSANPGTGVQSIATYLGCFPNARIMDVDATRGGVSLQAGCGGPTDWGGFIGNTDALVIGVSSSDTTFDFEPDTASVSGTKDVEGTFYPGSEVTYTVTLINGGGATQGDNPGDEFFDTLPSDLTLTGATATSGVATTSGNDVHWNGSISGGGTVTITITATINDDATGTISNQGTINYDSNNDGTNDTTVTTTSATGTVTTFVVVPFSVPTASPLGLALMALALTAGAFVALRR